MATEYKPGKWRAQVLISKPGEPRKVKSFYGDTADEADYHALQFKFGDYKEDKTSRTTIGDAVVEYIDIKRPVLSPSTIQGYCTVHRNYLTGIKDHSISLWDNRFAQRWVNTLLSKNSVKTAKNAFCLVNASIAYIDKNLYADDVVFPRKEKIIYKTPDGETLSRIYKASAGTNVEVPVLLASWLSLRMSEILGLKWDDVNDNSITVRRAVVAGEAGVRCVKSTKTESSVRTIPCPDYIITKIKAIEKTDDFIFGKINGKAMSHRFDRMLAKNGIEKCRFHDLRHSAASIMLQLGIPDKYAMERGGWSTPSVMKSVYQQTFTQEQILIAKRIDDFYLTLIQH